MFTDFNTAFPGDEHGLGFELYQHWYMGAMATPRTAGHTGFTGTSLVLDPTTDSFLIVLGNSVHPVRSWRSRFRSPGRRRQQPGPRRRRSAPRDGRTAWFSGMATATSATLTLPALALSPRRSAVRRLPARALWWDTEPQARTPSSWSPRRTAARRWQPVPFTTVRHGEAAQAHPAGTATGWSGRSWHRLTADLAAWRGTTVRLRWRYTTDQLYVGRGAYVDASRVADRRPDRLRRGQARGRGPDRGGGLDGSGRRAATRRVNGARYCCTGPPAPPSPRCGRALRSRRRRAPRPRRTAGRWRGRSPRPSGPVPSLRVGEGQVAVEDVAAGQPQVALQVERCLRLDARAAVRVGRQAVGERLGEVRVELRERRRRAAPCARRRCRRRTAGRACAGRTASASGSPAAARSGPRMDGSVSEWQ